MLDDDAAARVELDDASTPVRIVLAGSVGAYHSDEMFVTCLTALDRGRPVSLVCRDATHVGASIVQLALALRAALTQRGLALAIDEAPPSLAALLSLAGLTSTSAGSPP